MSFLKKKGAQSASETAQSEVETTASASQPAAHRGTARRGAFSAGICAVAVAVVVLFNLIVARLPDTATQFDMTNNGIYNITQTSRDYLSAMGEDVELHVLANRSLVDSRIVRFLDKYVSLTDRLTLEYTDPAVYPSALTQYGAESNTIVVVCPATGRQELVSLDDIIGYDMMSYYMNGTKTETDFDAEGLLTSAVDGVLTAASYKVYETEGHDETALPSAVRDLLQKSHFSVDGVNLLTGGGIPADCDLLILNAPVQDLADDELELVRAYLSAGGQVIYCMAGQNLPLPNLTALCGEYGLEVADGMIADVERCYQNNYFLFFPLPDNTVDAGGGVYTSSTILFYASRGMTIGTPARDTITAKSFLNTSDNGYAVRDDGTQVQGAYSVGAVATEQIDDGLTARLTVYGANSPIDESFLASYTNISNADLFMGSVTCGFDNISSINVEAVSLSDPMNTVTTGGLWALLFILVIPASCMVFGFVHWLRRRRL